jgi:hypothetical protein
MVRWIGIFPLHGTGRFVVLPDVAQELSLQIRDGSEYPSCDDVSLDLAEPQLDSIQPGRVGRSEVQVDFGMHRQEVRDRPTSSLSLSREASGQIAHPKIGSVLIFDCAGVVFNTHLSGIPSYLRKVGGQYLCLGLCADGIGFTIRAMTKRFN